MQGTFHDINLLINVYRILCRNSSQLPLRSPVHETITGRESIGESSSTTLKSIPNHRLRVDFTEAPVRQGSPNHKRVSPTHLVCHRRLHEAVFPSTTDLGHGVTGDRDSGPEPPTRTVSTRPTRVGVGSTAWDRSTPGHPR